MQAPESDNSESSSPRRRSVKTTSLAEAKLAAAVPGMHHGRVNPDRRLRFRDFQDEFLAKAASTDKKKTVRDYRSVLNRFKETFGEEYIDAIGVRDADAYAVGLVGMMKPASANMHIRVLKAAFNQAVDWELLPESPFRKVEQFTTDERPARTLSPKDFKAVLKAIRDGHPDHADVVEVLMLTGMRRSEALVLMSWGAVNFEANLITLTGTKGKKGTARKVRYIPLTPRVKKILLARRNEPYPFMKYDVRWKRRTRILPDDLTAVFSEVASSLGLSCTPHDLRRTFATMLADRNLSTFALTKILGHADPAITSQFYIGAMLGEAREKMLKVEKTMRKKP